MDKATKREVLKKVKGATSVEEVLAIAREDGMELSVENAEKIYNHVNQNRELSDDELERVVGGFLFFFF